MTVSLLKWIILLRYCSTFFFIELATTCIYTLSLHDALPISSCPVSSFFSDASMPKKASEGSASTCFPSTSPRSEEHTSELQSRENLVCRLLLEKKKHNSTTRLDIQVTFSENIHLELESDHEH